MDATTKAKLYERLRESFAAYARYESREMDADDFEQEMWLALFTDGLQAETTCCAPGSAPASEPLTEQTDSYIAQWAAGRARALILRERNAQDLEEFARAVSAGAYPESNPVYDDHKKVFGEHVGERPDPAPMEVIEDLDWHDWQAMLRRVAMLIGIDRVDLQACIGRLSERHQAIAFALLAGYSIREVERAGESRRQINKVKRALRGAGAA